jgi:hypothetical protein
VRRGDLDLDRPLRRYGSLESPRLRGYGSLSRSSRLGARGGLVWYELPNLGPVGGFEELYEDIPFMVMAGEGGDPGGGFGVKCLLSLDFFEVIETGNYVY